MTTNNWRDELDALLRENISYGAVTRKGKPRNRVREKTKNKRSDRLHLGFRELRALGIRLQSVRDFRENHLKLLVAAWEEKGLSASTITGRISGFRTFARWIGKAGMIRESERYVKDPASVQCTYAATTDKSWPAQNVDPQELITEIMRYDPHVAMQLRIIEAFGLRPEEGVSLKPYRADRDISLYANDGTKGDRNRPVPIATAKQRQVLDEAKAFVGDTPNNRSLANPRLTLTQAMRRFYYVLEKFGITRKKLGVTAHGLTRKHARRSPRKLRGYTPEALQMALPNNDERSEPC